MTKDGYGNYVTPTGSPGPSSPRPPQGSSSATSTFELRDRNWQDLFNGNLCIGENHADIAPKRWIIENMSRLKQEGFTCLILEHFAQDEHQDMMDDFMLKEQDMDDNLESYIKKLNQG